MRPLPGLEDIVSSRDARIAKQPDTIQQRTIECGMPRRNNAHYASASLAYCRHFFISAMRVDPSGTGYSISILPGIGYFSFLSNWSTCLIGVSPWPQGTFGP